MFNIICLKTKDGKIRINGKLIYVIQEFNQLLSTILQGKSEVPNVLLIDEYMWETLNKPKNTKDLLFVIISPSLNSQSEFNGFIYDNVEHFIDSFKSIHNKIYVLGNDKLYNEVFKYNIDYIYEFIVTTDKKKGNEEKGDYMYFPEYNKDDYNIIQKTSLISNNYITQYYADPYFIIMDVICYKKKTNMLGNYNSNFPNIYGKNSEEYSYLNLLSKILMTGEVSQTRNSEVLRLFSANLTFDLRNYNIPLLTTKYVYYKTVIKELLWFISGKTDNNILKKQNVHIWDGNSSREFLDKNGFKDREEGDLGPIYGHQWRHCGAEYPFSPPLGGGEKGEGVDQLQNCIDLINNDPTSRRMLVCSWNVPDLKKMALPPCHVLYQFYVTNNDEINLQLYQRSADMFLGVPFNIASYSLLIFMIAAVTNKKPGKLYITFGDCHIYKNHIEQVKKQLSRHPSIFPTIEINKKNNINDFELDDFKINNYYYHSYISADMVP